MGEVRADVVNITAHRGKTLKNSGQKVDRFAL